MKGGSFLEKTSFLKNPSLPSAEVKTVIMSDRIIQIVRELKENYSINAITPQSLPDISGSERFHADMAVCHLGGCSFIVSPSCTDTAAVLSEMGANVSVSGVISAECPRLNVCFVGKRLLCCKKTTQPEILSFCKENGIPVLHTKQRYTKCSAAVVSENAVITADESISRVCREKSIDVLKIPPGGIELEGYPYGFIGGACGLISPGLLAFAGRVEAFGCFNDIKAFAGNHGVDIVSLGNNNLYDIGGIVPVTERKETH